MGHQHSLPPGLPPRLITREAAAAYVNLSPNKFDELVRDGLMPGPVKMPGRRRPFDVRALDAAVDAPLVDPDSVETALVDTWA